MVPTYEKYCSKCAENKKQNDLNFWKTHGYDYFEEPKRTNEIKKDTRLVGMK